MNKTTIALLVAANIAAVSPASAGVAEELAAMKTRIAQLEAQLAEQKSSIEKQQVAIEEQSSSNSVGGFAENVSVGGAAEFLLSHTKDDSGDTSSDIELDTFELEIEAEINEMVTLTSLIEYENNALDVTEAYAVIGNPDSNFSYTVGKAPVPFLVANGGAWTDPLTDDFADITEGMAMVSYSADALSLDAYTYNNDSGDSINTLGFNAELALENGLTLGTGYINDVHGTNGLPAGDAWRVNALLETGALALSAEYIDVNADAGADPSVLHLNADYALSEEGNIFLSYSESDDANGIIAEKRTIIGADRALGENATVVAELVREEAYNGEEDDTINIVLVTEF